MVLQDLQVVGPGLDDVSIDDLLRFRERYGAEHRAYMRELRRFVADASQLTREEEENALYDRRRELEARVRDLRHISAATWKSAARFLLGITGAGLTLAAGNVPGAAVSATAALLGLGGAKETGHAFTYLCHLAQL
jgi:hypothetical protein